MNEPDTRGAGHGAGAAGPPPSRWVPAARAPGGRAEGTSSFQFAGRG